MKLNKLPNGKQSVDTLFPVEVNQSGTDDIRLSAVEMKVKTNLKVGYNQSGTGGGAAGESIPSEDIALSYGETGIP